jgi:hypothetical protein
MRLEWYRRSCHGIQCLVCLRNAWYACAGYCCIRASKEGPRSRQGNRLTTDCPSYPRGRDRCGRRPPSGKHFPVDDAIPFIPLIIALGPLFVDRRQDRRFLFLVLCGTRRELLVEVKKASTFHSLHPAPAPAPATSAQTSRTIRGASQRMADECDATADQQTEWRMTRGTGFRCSSTTATTHISHRTLAQPHAHTFPHLSHTHKHTTSQYHTHAHTHTHAHIRKAKLCSHPTIIPISHSLIPNPHQDRPNHIAPHRTLPASASALTRQENWQSC